mmetsp:Transcript_14575/g.31018  ORF Transcript_14575/g.31018 Transcript_14575/m.31018 type:complete len:218 (-) Transcript_14575:53-706(-)
MSGTGQCRGIVVDQNVVVFVIVHVAVFVVVDDVVIVVVVVDVVVRDRLLFLFRNLFQDFSILVQDIEFVFDVGIVAVGCFLTVRQDGGNHPLLSVSVLPDTTADTLHPEIGFQRRNPVPAGNVSGDEVLLVGRQIRLLFLGAAAAAPLPGRAPKDQLVAGSHEFFRCQHALFQKGGFRQLGVGPFPGASEGSQYRGHIVYIVYIVYSVYSVYCVWKS